VLYFINFIYSSGFIYQFTCAVLAIRERLKLIHEKELSKRFLSNYEVDVIVELFEILFDGLKLINSHITFQLIPIFAYLLASLTFTFYSVIRSFMLNSPLKYYVMAPNSIWLVFHSFAFMMLIHASVTTIDALEEIYNFEYQILTNQKIMDARSKEQFFKFVKLVKKVNFRLKTALFDIDWKLFVQCTSAVITFLIITCQFETSMPDCSAVNLTKNTP
jgi:hypothetical protein